MREALTTGRIENPKVASLLGIYTLTKELGISPKEAYEMPYTLARDLLTVHGVIETIKSEQIESKMGDATRKIKSI